MVAVDGNTNETPELICPAAHPKPLPHCEQQRFEHAQEKFFKDYQIHQQFEEAKFEQQRQCKSENAHGFLGKYSFFFDQKIDIQQRIANDEKCPDAIENPWAKAIYTHVNMEMIMPQKLYLK